MTDIYRVTSCFKICFLLSLMMLIIEPSFSQGNTIQKPKFKFQHLNLDLNSNSVESIIQDSYGYVWIGTLGGLHRYDGERVSVYLSSKDTNSIAGDRVECIFEDSKKRLWLGTEFGISKYSREFDNFSSYPIETLSNNTKTEVSDMVDAITEDENGRVWIGSRSHGLQYFDENTKKFVSYFKDRKDIDKHRKIASLWASDGNIIWIGTENHGLTRLNTKTGKFDNFRHVPENEKTLSGNFIEDILEDRKGNIWAATREYGLNKINFVQGEIEVKRYYSDPENEYSLFNNDVTTIYEDNNGKIWICNENGGLHQYNEVDDNFFRFLPDPGDFFSISNVSVKVVYQDHQGRFWIGSNLEGIDIMDKNQFRFDHYFQTADEKGLNNNIIRTIKEDEKGNLWISTDGGGLNYFDRNKDFFKAYKHDPNKSTSISSNAVLALADGEKGEIWVGTWRGGINIFNPRSQKFKLLEPENQNLKKVFYLYKDKDRNIWVGTQSEGISIYFSDEKQFYNYRYDPDNPESLGNNDVRCILQDYKGRMWLGTEFNGLNQAIPMGHPEFKFKRYNHNDSDSTSLANSKVNDLFEDSHQRLWIATEGGLCLYNEDDNNFISYKTANGLSSNHIKSIIEDDHGFLWIGTAKGISKFDPENGTFRNYNSNDGLQDGAFTRNSAYKTSKGELIFGGTNGFNIFHPDSIRDNPHKPQVYLTDLKIFNKSVKINDENAILKQHISVTEEITISYKESVFSLDFVALNYTHSHMNQYAFMMENFEDSWNYVGGQKTATYTNLDPGRYVFRVKAANNDGLWNEEGRSLVINITPPFWKTPLFIAVASLFLFGLVYLAINFRIRQLNRKNIELEEKVDKRTFQLNSLISELKEKQSEIQTTNKELKITHRQLESINNQLDKRVQERTSKLLKANQQLDRFVYSASHDLSAPLKSILGLINITKLENNDENIQGHLNHMEKSVHKLDDVISSLTQFSRNMGSDVQKVDFYFTDIVDEVLDDLTHLLKKKNIRIIKNYQKGDMLKSDFLRIKIILSNLISNAVKYIDKHKSDHIITITFSKSKNSNTITIEDNGMGIKKEYQKKIYDMFFRVSTESEGSGLGLFIVKETTEKLKGKIKLESEIGVFTNFTVNLPN